MTRVLAESDQPRSAVNLLDQDAAFLMYLDTPDAASSGSNARPMRLKGVICAIIPSNKHSMERTNER